MPRLSRRSHRRDPIVDGALPGRCVSPRSGRGRCSAPSCAVGRCPPDPEGRRGTRPHVGPAVYHHTTASMWARWMSRAPRLASARLGSGSMSGGQAAQPGPGDRRRRTGLPGVVGRWGRCSPLLAGLRDIPGCRTGREQPVCAPLFAPGDCGAAVGHSSGLSSRPSSGGPAEVEEAWRPCSVAGTLPEGGPRFNSSGGLARSTLRPITRNLRWHPGCGREEPLPSVAAASGSRPPESRRPS